MIVGVFFNFFSLPTVLIDIHSFPTYLTKWKTLCFSSIVEADNCSFKSYPRPGKHYTSREPSELTTVVFRVI